MRGEERRADEATPPIAAAGLASCSARQPGTGEGGPSEAGGIPLVSSRGSNPCQPSFAAQLQASRPKQLRTTQDAHVRRRGKPCRGKAGYVLRVGRGVPAPVPLSPLWGLHERKLRLCLGLSSIAAASCPASPANRLWWVRSASGRDWT
eukprot:COSAG05_NODE_999_length_6247_cov_26.499024_7_plen_149_part_00